MTVRISTTVVRNDESAGSLTFILETDRPADVSFTVQVCTEDIDGVTRESGFELELGSGFELELGSGFELEMATGTLHHIIYSGLPSHSKICRNA